MGRLVLLICILNPREARDQGRMKPFARGQVDLRELKQIYCIPELSIHPLLVRTPGHQYVIFISCII